MKVKPYKVVPKLPEALQPLRDISMNLWSSWNWQAAQLFIRLDAETWEKCRQNLVMTLGQIPQSTLEEAARDESFIANLERVNVMLKTYLELNTWFAEDRVHDADMVVAYFSMEYGMDVGLPIYSGGLGVLSGDHLKSSSDLGIPLVAVGLLYQQGYFEQYLNSDGWQMERYPVNDWYSMPVTLERDSKGIPITISVALDGEELFAHIWRVKVGRINLYLLDANIVENPLHLRQVTAQLYGGDRDNRIRQEILLGVGGVRALSAMGIKPDVFHMNEGHSVFLALERIRDLMQSEGLSFAEAREIVWASTAFTTHTPVPAGNETFAHDRMRKYFGKFIEQLGLGWDQFLELGTEPGKNEVFSMTVLALKMAAFCNGVSKLHGDVSRKMWMSLWPSLPEKELPIGHVTNGIHTRTWISHDLDDLLQRYLGPQFLEEPNNHKLWNKIERIPDLELWRIHQIRKERLIFFARKRLERQLERRGAGSAEMKSAEEVLSSRALTIGFARRFATYKRANLMLSDPDRLRRIMLNPNRPVQFIFAGKAHPQDNEGKEFIRRLVHFSSDPEIRNHFVFIEDYGINVARYMVQGVDVWLSTPRRPLEASGTSGMKAAANGAINLSTLDGWWAEAYTPEVGWAIGSGETDVKPDEQDRIESEALYNLLENDVVPAYFDLDRTETPRRWISMMKQSMIALGQQFNTHRMVMEYCDHYYIPAHRASAHLRENRCERARNLASWKGRVTKEWQKVSVRSEDINPDREVSTGEALTLKARIGLGGLKPDDVAVEVLHGLLDSGGEIQGGRIARLKYEGESDGLAEFSGSLTCDASGRHGFAVRVRGDHPDLVHPYMPLFLIWE